MNSKTDPIKIPKSDDYLQILVNSNFNHSVFGDIPVQNDVVGSYQNKVIDVLGDPIDLSKNDVEKLKKWCLSKGLEDSGKCRYIPKNLKEESFWIFSDGYTIPIGFHISSKKSNLNIDVIAFDDYYYIVTISRDEINSDTKLIYRRDYVYKCDQPEGLFKLLNNLPFDVTKNKKWYSNILNFKSFKESYIEDANK